MHLAIADEEVLPIEEKPKIGVCFSDGKQDPSVWKRSEFKQFIRDDNGPVPMTLNFVVRSRANVLGKLVSPKFYKEINCPVVFDQKHLNVPISLKDSCTYD